VKTVIAYDLEGLTEHSPVITSVSMYSILLSFWITQKTTIFFSSENKGSRPFDTSVNLYRIMWHHIPENYNVLLLCRRKPAESSEVGKFLPGYKM